MASSPRLLPPSAVFRACRRSSSWANASSSTPVAKPQLGEVVRIDESGVTVKPFETTMKAGLGTTARRRGFVTISPHPSWKGRIVNALGAPIDDGAPLFQGERPVLSDREPPPAMRRQRARTPLKTGVRVIDFFTPLCAGPAHRHFRGLRHRQVDAARHARPLPRLRHCRHRRWLANAAARCATSWRMRSSSSASTPSPWSPPAMKAR